jgi:signal transduction histidine kinase
MANNLSVVQEERSFTLVSLPPGPAQERLALAVMLALAVCVAFFAGPLSSIQLEGIPNFTPALIMPLVMTEALTAMLLYAQFSIIGSVALVVLASGYLFTSITLVAWLLALPGVFSPGGVLGAGLQSGLWIGVTPPLAFPLFVIAYALLKDATPTMRKPRHPPGSVVAASVVIVSAAVCAATILLIAFDAQLPRIMLDSTHFSRLFVPLSVAIVSLTYVALAVVWYKRGSVLDLWLIVVMWAHASGGMTLLATPTHARFTIGWYATRGFEFIAGSVVLFVLLYEITVLYGQLLGAVLAQRREREARLMTGDAVAATIAHEIKQPLTGMVTNVRTGLRWLDRSELDEAKLAMKRAAADGDRVAAVIDSIRSLFKRDTANRSPFDLNKLIAEALSFLRYDLQKYGVKAETQSAVQPAPVVGNAVQLRQVLLNLMTNAIEAMADAQGPRVLTVRVEVEDRNVLASVADTGPGIAGKDTDWLFKPLLTTKSQGMGMGLTISRSIVESHGGRMWADPNAPRGAVFRFSLPAEPAILTDGSSSGPVV